MRPLESVEKEKLSGYLEEDSGSGDPASDQIEGDGRAEIMCRGDCVLSGLEAVEWIFRHLGCSLDFEEGAGSGGIWKAGRVCLVSGGIREMLRGERTALNILSRMSGIASGAREASEIAEKTSPGTRVAGTRKTTPGFSLFEKRALIDGGALPHRMNLSQLAMIKDNHIAALGGDPEGMKKAVEMIRRTHGPYMLIEVEVEDENMAIGAVDAGSDIIMLDNLPPERCREISEIIRKRSSEWGRAVIIEASGGITIDDIPYYAPHVDVISMGSLTYDYRAVGFSMDLIRSG